MTEIEMKAWVRDPAATLALLREHGEKVRDYRKEDEYYLAPARTERFHVRLRNQDGTWIMTLKERTREDKMEINVEREAELSDPAPLRHLLLKLGFTLDFTKRKTGSLWRLKGRADGPSLELSDVPPLGTFLEVEFLTEAADGHSPDAKRAYRGEILRLFALFGIAEEDIEDRSFARLLRELS